MGDVQNPQPQGAAEDPGAPLGADMLLESKSGSRQISVPTALAQPAAEQALPAAAMSHMSPPH
jgi:hypothetical protein